MIARARLTYDNGTEARADVKYGNLEVLPLPTGQSARLLIQPHLGADVGYGPGRGGTVPVSGGEMGVVIDGRGRPLILPEDGGRRRELIKKWHMDAGRMM